MRVAKDALLSGTTQVLLISDVAVVIGSDRAQYGSGIRRRKTDRVGRVIVGISGTVAVLNADGTVAVDLQDSVPPILRGLDWNEPHTAVDMATAEIRDLLPALEGRHLRWCARSRADSTCEDPGRWCVANVRYFFGPYSVPRQIRDYRNRIQSPV